MRGGHEHENVAHWHLFVKFPNGRVNELTELFRDTVGDLTTADNVQKLYGLVRELLDRNDIASKFYLTWHNCILNNPAMLLRDVSCKGILLTQYNKNLTIHLYDETNEAYVGSEHDLPDNYIGAVHDAENISVYKRPAMAKGGKTRARKRKSKSIKKKKRLF
jgi:hypothetical protein